MFDPKKKHSERELMELAVRLAEKSVPENDGRSHPMVGHQSRRLCSPDWLSRRKAQLAC